MDRRTFLARTGTVAGISGLAGCSSLPGLGNGGTDPLGLAFQAPAETVDVNTWYAAGEVVAERGGDALSPAVFEGVDLAVQSVLSGENDIARGSVTAAAALADAGREFRFVAAPIRATDYVLVAREGIDSLEAIVEENATIGMSAPTALDAVQTAALLFEEGIIDDVDELDFQRVGTSGTRMSAIREGSIDVSPQHFAQWQVLREADDSLRRLATFGDRLDSWVQETYMAPASVIEERREELTEFLAAQIVANRRLYGDYERYAGLVDEHVDGGGPEASVLDASYEFLTEIGVWPEGGGLTRENVDYMLDLSNRLGLTEERIPTDGVLERGPLADALDRVGTPGGT